MNTEFTTDELKAFEAIKNRIEKDLETQTYGNVGVDSYPQATRKVWRRLRTHFEESGFEVEDDGVMFGAHEP